MKYIFGVLRKNVMPESGAGVMLVQFDENGEGIRERLPLMTWEQSLSYVSRQGWRIIQHFESADNGTRFEAVWYEAYLQKELIE